MRDLYEGAGVSTRESTIPGPGQQESMLDTDSGTPLAQASSVNIWAALAVFVAFIVLFNLR